MPDLRDALREVIKIRDEWNATTNPILHAAAGRLNWLTSYREILDTQPEAAAAGDHDPGLDWHINDGCADTCGCRYEGEGRDSSGSRPPRTGDRQ